MRVEFTQPMGDEVRLDPYAEVNVPDDLPLTDEAGNRVGTVISASAVDDGRSLSIVAEVDSPEVAEGITAGSVDTPEVAEWLTAGSLDGISFTPSDADG